MKMNKVKATWYRVVYRYYDMEFDYWVDSYEFDKDLTINQENPIAVKEYDTVDEAVRDFLENNVKKGVDYVRFGEPEMPPCVPYWYFFQSKKRISVQQEKDMKIDGDGKLVPISHDEIRDMYHNGNGLVEYYNYHVILQLEYPNHYEANTDAGKVFEEKYAREYKHSN